MTELVCSGVTNVLQYSEPCKTAEPIKMPFWMWTRGVQGITYYISPTERGSLEGDLTGNLLVAEVDGGQKCLVDLSAVHVVQQEPHRLYAALRGTKVGRKLYTQ